MSYMIFRPDGDQVRARVAERLPHNVRWPAFPPPD
jgi:hypothetical protein